jgi:hypothetical protein
MNIVEIEKLAHVRARPAVSLVCRLDRRRPGNLEDPRRLAALRNRGVEQIRGAYDDTTTTRVIARLDEALSEIDLEHPDDGVAVFATADESHLVGVPFAVRDRVVVAADFAIRELLDAMQRMARAYVVVFASEDARCFEAHDHALSELHDHGFPLHLEPPRQADTPHRDLPIGEHENAEAHRTVTRAIDTALGELYRRERLPVILVAPVRDLAYFDEVTGHEREIIARVHGNHVDDSADVIAQLVAPALDTEVDLHRAEAIRRAEESLGGPAVAGLDECCPAARDGRGRELVIEHDLGDDPGDADRVNTLVDDVLSHGGTVTVVPTGALTHHGRVVLIERY